MSARWFQSAAVASPHLLASRAGLDVLREGGNALDAAVAINLTLGVVTPYLCGYGGDLFAMVWDGSRLHGYNGSGRAPARATLDAFPATGVPFFGALPVTVPGAPAAWFDLLERFGTRSFADLASRAHALARDGFEVSERAAASFRGPRTRLEEWSRVYGDVRAGEVLRQPGLARTIETLSTTGPDAYYRGEIADAIVACVRGFDGLLEPDDLASHTGDWVEPLVMPYRDVEIAQLPPNTQGVTALEALKIFEGLDVGDPRDREHLLIESAKLALADREAFVTDPDAMRVDPRVLFSDEWCARRRASIDRARAVRVEPGRLVPGGTAFMCAADASGMMVSLIQSNWTGFGSGITVPGYGINLHNRGSLFSVDPDHVNVIAPRKRTMHTLIPAVALREGAPWMAFGSMGGHGQAQTHLQLVARIVDDGADPQDAIDAPRWCVRPDDWSVDVEPRFGAGVVDGLRERGHVVRETELFTSLMGHAHAIVRDLAGGWRAASDPRCEGAALGF